MEREERQTADRTGWEILSRGTSPAYFMCWAYTAHSSSRERRILYFVPFSLTTQPTSAAMRRRLELLLAPLVFIWKQQRRGDRPNKRTNGDFEERSYYAKGKPRGAAQQANAPLPCCARVFRAIVHSSATTVCQPTAWQHQAAACSVCTYIRTNGRKVCVERSHVQFLVDDRRLQCCCCFTTIIFVFPYKLSEDDFNFLSHSVISIILIRSVVYRF